MNNELLTNLLNEKIGAIVDLVEEFVEYKPKVTFIALGFDNDYIVSGIFFIIEGQVVLFDNINTFFDSSAMCNDENYKHKFIIMLDQLKRELKDVFVEVGAEIPVEIQIVSDTQQNIFRARYNYDPYPDGVDFPISFSGWYEEVIEIENS